MEFQSEYVISAYSQFNVNVQQEMQKCLVNKDEEECVKNVKQEYAGNKMKLVKQEYEGYLEELIKRK